MVFDKQFFLNLLSSFLRFALASVGTWFVQKGIGTQGEWEFLIGGGAMLIITTASILYGRYKSRLHFLAALNSKPGTSEETVRAEAEVRAASSPVAKMILALLCVSALLFSQVACGPSRETLVKFQDAGFQLRQVLNVNASLPEQLLSDGLLTEEQFALVKVAQTQLSSGVDIYNQTLARVLSGEQPIKVMAPIAADLIAKLRTLKALAGSGAQKVMNALEISLRVVGTYFALQIARARSAGYTDHEICAKVGLPYDLKRFKLLAET